MHDLLALSPLILDSQEKGAPLVRCDGEVCVVCLINSRSSSDSKLTGGRGCQMYLRFFLFHHLALLFLFEASFDVIDLMTAI